MVSSRTTLQVHLLIPFSGSPFMSLANHPPAARSSRSKSRPLCSAQGLASRTKLSPSRLSHAFSPRSPHLAGTIIGQKHFNLMAAIDSTKTACAYQHMFRAVKNRAKEINDQIASGKVSTTTTSTPTSNKAKGGTGGTTSASSRKCGRCTFGWQYIQDVLIASQAARQPWRQRYLEVMTTMRNWNLRPRSKRSRLRPWKKTMTLATRRSAYS